MCTAGSGGWRGRWLFAVAVCVTGAPACGRIGFDECVEPCAVTSEQIELIEVEPVYPAHANWNDYVLADNGGTTRYDQPDTACTGANRGYRGCIHGGELRRARLIGTTSCSGVDATDERAALTWWCDDAQGAVVIYSRGLSPDAGLADLLASDRAFADNSLTVRRDGVIIARSEPSRWWANVVLPLPDNAAGPRATLNMEGAVYVLAASRPSDGYQIAADRVALVTRGGATLSYSGSNTSNCNAFTAAATPADETCLVAASDQLYLWIEGSFDASSAGGSSSGLGIFVSDPTRRMRFTTLRRIAVRGAAGKGISAVVQSSWLEQITTSNNGGRGLHLGGDSSEVHGVISRDNYEGIGAEYASGFVLTDLRLLNNSFAGMTLGGPMLTGFRIHRVVAAGSPTGLSISSVGTVLTDVVVSNNARGLSYYQGGGLTVVGLLAHHNDRGLYLPFSDDATLLQVTLVGNSYGLEMGIFTDKRLLASVVAVDNAVGLQSGNGSDVVWSHLAIANNGTGLLLDTTNKFHFGGPLLMSANSTNCSVAGTGSPGLTAACANAGTSNADLVAAVAVAADFVGKVSVDDVANQSDVDGTAICPAAPQALDGLGFDHELRGWGRDGGFPDAAQRGRPVAGTGCRIWDYRLLSSGGAIVDRSGAGRATNQPFVAAGPCPAAVDGDAIVGLEVQGDGLGDDDNLCEPGEPCTSQFLVNARERVGDGRGDDDGLCETDEACIYAPNFGTYQGEGDPFVEAPCTFVDGSVTGVTMYRYPVNGAAP